MVDVRASGICTVYAQAHHRDKPIQQYYNLVGGRRKYCRTQIGRRMIGIIRNQTVSSCRVPGAVALYSRLLIAAAAVDHPVLASPVGISVWINNDVLRYVLRT